MVSHDENSKSAPPIAEQNKGVALLWAALGVLVIGVGVAIHLVGIKLDILHGGTGNDSCVPSDTVDCGAVNTSDYAMIGPVPISLIAIPTYFLLGYLLITALRARRSGQDEKGGAFALELGTVIGLLTCVYSIFLFYISKTVVGKVCTYCIALYVVNFSVTGLFIAAGPRSVLGPIFNVFEALKAVLPAAGVFIISAGLAWMVYEEVKISGDAAVKSASIARSQAIESDPAIQARIAERARERARAASKRATAPQPAPRVTTPARPATSRPTTARKSRRPVNRPAVASARPRVRRCSPIDVSKAVRMGTPTKQGDGYPYFETPLQRDCEFWYGNPDAKVTVVKYADFQCTYCKFLDSAMKKVKKKYKDQVRFVMKHFPMNAKCNPRMRGYDKHPYACEAAFAGHCAGIQGRFWEMHDAMYARQKDIEPTVLRKLAEQVGLDMAAYDSCLVDPRTAAAIKQDIAIAFRAGIWGTPKTYINDRLITGAASSSVLEYHIKRALQGRGPGKKQPKRQVKMAPKPDGTGMIAAKTATKTFYIDPYESALDNKGRAVMVVGAEPAQVDWFTAKKACTAAGKRLCTQEEWMSACTNTPAVDNNKNGWFSDDEVEGDMYPYGPFYVRGNCQDQADKYNGKALPVGTKPKCRTASGIFDLTGNIGEWVNADPKKATLMGGNAGTGERAACNQRSYGRGLGRRNHTTGFRCCADTNVRTQRVAKSALKKEKASLMGSPVPAFRIKDRKGKLFTPASFKGKVTLLNFYASWCGPCKKEFPYLTKYLSLYKAKGFQILAFGQDTQAQRSYDFADKYNATFNIAHDEESRLMGLFKVYSMPTTYLIDRKGIVRYMDTGFKPSEQAEKLKQAIVDLL